MESKYRKMEIKFIILNESLQYFFIKAINEQVRDFTQTTKETLNFRCVV